MHDIPMFETQKTYNCFKEKQARILAGDLDIKHIYHILKKTMKLIKILIPTCFCSDFF